MLFILLTNILFANTFTLTFGKAQLGHIAKGKMDYYKIVVAQGQSITSMLNRLDADADLYVRVEERPTTDIFDCKSEKGERNDESCTLPVADKNRVVYIGVYGYESTHYTITTKTANLIFKSSFEDGSHLLNPDRKDSPIWWQNIKNDEDNDFNWPIKLQEQEGNFQMIVEKNNINKYIVNKIETTKDVNAQETKALHQIIKKKEFGWTQDPYIIDMEGKEQKQLYIRYSLKVPKNLSKILGKKNGWLVLSEFKTISDYRLALYIYTDEKTGKPYWYAHGDNVVLDDIPYKEYWYRENRNISVLEDKWMDIEIFWNRSTNKKDGRVWLTIDGKTAIDYHGITKFEDDPINEIMLFTNYANVPLDQWIDNLEVWSDFPCGEGKSCH